MTPAQVAHIMSLVQAYASMWKHDPAGTADKEWAAVEAALRDAPQAEPLTVDEYQAKYANIIHLTNEMRYGYECLYHELTRTPSAPTAVEPDERAMFEAWFEADSFPAEADWFRREIDDHDEYFYANTHTAWKAWRASKGTPL